MASPTIGLDDYDVHGIVKEEDASSTESEVWDTDLEMCKPSVVPKNFVDAQPSNVSIWDDDDQGVAKSIEAFKKGTEHDAESNATPIITRQKLFILTTMSNGWFTIGSVFYVWLAVIDLQWEKDVENVEDFVLEADDDWTWGEYASHIEDDYVFQAKNGADVSQAQIIYAIAAFSFVATGFIDLFASPGWLGIWFIMAGIFGFVSAIYLEKNEHLSNVFNLVSVCLFLVEAVGLFFHRILFRGWLRQLVRLGDFFFALGAILDVVLGFIYLYNLTNVRLAKLEVAAQVFWLVCSLIYIWTTIYGKVHGEFDLMYRQELEDENENDKTFDIDEEVHPEQAPMNMQRKELEDEKEISADLSYPFNMMVLISDSAHSVESGKEHEA